jgi:hypothetical protein
MGLVGSEMCIRDSIETPRQEAYGQVVVFKDKYGNKWDLIEVSSQ